MSIPTRIQSWVRIANTSENDNNIPMCLYVAKTITVGKLFVYTMLMLSSVHVWRIATRKIAFVAEKIQCRSIVATI